jgi:superfamily II DNA/RNA helicase
MYFGNQRGKKCPICKQIIEMKELKKNEIISKVEQILNKCESQQNKIDELAALIEENKNEFDKKQQFSNIKFSKFCPK